MDEKFILADLLEERYKEKNNLQEIPKELKESLKEYKKSNREKVSDFLCALGVEEYLDDFKEKTKSGNGYVFYDEEKEFIVSILDVAKEDKYRLIRERRYTELSDDDAFAAFDLIHKMFLRRGFSGEKLNRRIEGPYNLLDYPVHNINKKIQKTKQEFDKIQAFMFKQRNKRITSADDNYEWINFVEKDISKRFKTYIDLYEEMNLARKEEMSNVSLEWYLSLSDEERDAMELNNMVMERIYTIYLNMDEVKNLLKRERKITREPEISFEGKDTKSTRESYKLIQEHESRNDYSVKEVQELLSIMKQKDKYWNIAEERAIAELTKETGMSREKLLKDPVFDYDGLMSPEELLRQSLKEINFK